MAAAKKARAKKAEAGITSEATEPRYEIKVFDEWHAVDHGNVLKDDCLHWQIGGDEFGIKKKGKWRVARA